MTLGLPVWGAEPVHRLISGGWVFVPGGSGWVFVPGFISFHFKTVFCRGGRLKGDCDFETNRSDRELRVIETGFYV